jgi:hypothetical protein
MPRSGQGEQCPESNHPNMALRALWGTVADLRREHEALRSTAPTKEETASFELAANARDFSRRTREVLDDKLSFSATLIRAGEVDAANRLIVELERDVRTEEAALLERANEARFAGAVRRARLTRVRLLRTLVAAAVGATLLATSAFGFAVAAALRAEDRPGENGTKGATGLRAGPTLVAKWQEQAQLRRIRVGDVRITLTRTELRRYHKLIRGPINDRKLAAFLRTVLPLDLVAEAKQAIVASITPASDVASSVGVSISAPDVGVSEATVQTDAPALALEKTVDKAHESVADDEGTSGQTESHQSSGSDSGTSSAGSSESGASDDDSPEPNGQELGGGLPALPGGG